MTLGCLMSSSTFPWIKQTISAKVFVIWSMANYKFEEKGSRYGYQPKKKWRGNGQPSFGLPLNYSMSLGLPIQTHPQTASNDHICI